MGPGQAENRTNYETDDQDRSSGRSSAVCVQHARGTDAAAAPRPSRWGPGWHERAAQPDQPAARLDQHSAAGLHEPANSPGVD